MAVSKLNWEGFSWADFQVLGINVAENIFPGFNFDEHLKHGENQDGIDIISYNKDGRAITIQCKCVGKISKGRLEAIVNAFISGDFIEKSSYFIICTNANMQTRTMQQYVQQYKAMFLQKYGITFECWDRPQIETRLRKMWNVVVKHFGKYEADKFCHPQLNNTRFKEIQPVINYISRKATGNDKREVSEALAWLTEKKKVNLGSLFTEDRLKTKRICLIGDAYQGKSFYLRQTAYELMLAGLRIQPLFLEIKKSNVQPVETLLELYYQEWKDIPFKEIVLFIDGLDEVPTEKFIETVNNISQFSHAYPAVNIVVSCRKLFFNHYNIENRLDRFEIYHIAPLDSEAIDTYLEEQLKKQKHDFRDAASHANVVGMLYHPFYFLSLVAQFKQPPHKISGSRIAILRDFIEQANQRSLDRQTTGSEMVKQDSRQFKNVIDKLALALQLAGKNAFDDEDMQELFSTDERLLLKHNSLLDVSGNSWSFTNAMFQEHLAASLISKMSFDKIISLCSVGRITPKIKTKWIQTISTVLSLLDYNAPLFQQLFAFIQKDNIELIFQT
ncbi:MAG TPA: hypothetical protein VGM63_13910, partial [Mucilaginibacter sp.]